MTSFIAPPPAFVFQIALLTLLCLEQFDRVPKPTKRPRKVSGVIVDDAHQGHAPWLRRILSALKENSSEGARPLPWLNTSLAKEGHNLTWTSAGNVKTLRSKKKVSFCSGAIIDGEPQPFVTGAGALHITCCHILCW